MDFDIKQGSKGMVASPNIGQYAGSKIDGTSSRRFTTEFPLLPSSSSTFCIETERNRGRRSSATPSSSVHSARSDTVLQFEREPPLVISRRGRKSVVQQHNSEQQQPSSLSWKPSSSFRPRYAVARRYSPSPENRAGLKMKNVGAQWKTQARSQKNKMEYRLSRLPADCVSTSNIVLECLKCDISEFASHSEVIMEEQKEEPSIFSESTSTSIAPVKEKLSTVSSDEEEEEDNKTPIVRMADIGAAPFTTSSLGPISDALAVNPRKRPRASLPVIKLPRRRTLGRANRFEDTEKSSKSAVPSKLTKSEALSKQMNSEASSKQTQVEAHLTQTVARVSERMSGGGEGSSKKKEERFASEVSDASSIGASHGSSKSSEWVASEISSASSTASLSTTSEDTSNKEKIRSPAPKRRKQTFTPLAEPRPKRLSAGKTPDFLRSTPPVEATRRKRRSTLERIPTRKASKTDVCSEKRLPTGSNVAPEKDLVEKTNITDSTNGSQEGPNNLLVEKVSEKEAPKVTATEDPSSTTAKEESESLHSEKASERQTSTRSSVERITTSEEKERIAKLEAFLRFNDSKRGCESRRPSIVAPRRAAKVAASSSVEEALSASSSETSSAASRVRRSTRGHTLPSKLCDSAQKLTLRRRTWSPAKHVNPNSALGILRRVSRYTRPIRSPSPPPSKSATPKCEARPVESHSESITASNIGAQPEELKTTVSEGSDQSAALENEIGGDARDSCRIVAEVPSSPQKPNQEHEEEKQVDSDESAAAANSTAVESSSEPSSSAHGTIVSAAAKGGAEISSPALIHADSTTVCSAVESASSFHGDSDSAVIKCTAEPSARGEPEGAALIAPSPSIHGRISSRAVRPSSRFLNEDFISPLRKKRISSTNTTQKKVREVHTPEQAKSIVTVAAEDVEQSAVASGPTTEQVDDATSTSNIPSAAAQTTLTKPAAPKRSHVMKTRRSSDEQPRIKLKIKLGRTPWIKIVGANNETKKEESNAVNVSDSKEPVLMKRKSAKRYISPWSHYVPSVKPVLGNIYYSDGTVEKLGVSVNAVMDRLLAEVCQDGISRHSTIVNKREKKKRNIEKARERVHRLKEERKARLAQGIITAPKDRSLSTSQENDSQPRVRSGRHRLLQNDFLYPSLKRGTKAEKKKNEEIRRQRSRNVMNQLAESTRGQASPSATQRGMTASVSKPAVKPREPSPFDPEKEELLRREAELREKQKRLTMPISFNTFLSSKTSVLTAQPLLQPQRSGDRTTAPDHFFRELLCEKNSTGANAEDTWNDFDMDADDGLDVTTIEAVHIPKLDDYVAPPEMDETSELVATAVEEMLMRPGVYSESEDGISYLRDRALEQPELRRNLLYMAIDCVSNLHVARLSAQGREAAIAVYNAVTAEASKMRDVICMFSREREEAVFWMHRYLVEMLPVELLATYLLLLRYTRLLNCQVKSIIRSTQNDSSPWPEITNIILKYIEVNVVEPDAAELDRTIIPGSLSDVVFVLVAPNISIGDFSVRDRHYDPIFKWLREMGNPASVMIRLKIDDTFTATVSDIFFAAVGMISRAVKKIVREHKQKRIVLVGWGTTCCFNHVVLNTVPGVSSIIDLAYPLLTVDGSRGEPDDDILLTYCPTLFVVGAEACDYHPGAMKMMRSNMIMPTGLVVIGHANNNLLVSCSTLTKLRITQRVVNRCVVEQICDFLAMEWTKRERSRLTPTPLNDIFKIDLTQLKIDAKAAQASKRPKEDQSKSDRERKKKLSGTPLSSPIPREPSPSPLPISQLDSMRSNFQNLLKKAGNEKALRWSEERQILANAFKEPRLPLKSGSDTASTAPGHIESPNLLDPASISLT